MIIKILSLIWPVFCPPLSRAGHSFHKKYWRARLKPLLATLSLVARLVVTIDLQWQIRDKKAHSLVLLLFLPSMMRTRDSCYQNWTFTPFSSLFTLNSFRFNSRRRKQELIFLFSCRIWAQQWTVAYDCENGSPKWFLIGESICNRFAMKNLPTNPFILEGKLSACGGQIIHPIWATIQQHGDTSERILVLETRQFNCHFNRS